jgi:hypothetical protein
LDIRISYNPVAGAFGHAVASLFGADAKSQMDEDLMRMKSMIETGVPPHDSARKDQNGCFVSLEPKTSTLDVEVKISETRPNPRRFLCELQKL